MWALGLGESRRSPGPPLLAHHEAVPACLRRNGFSVVMASHAFSALDVSVYGFVLTEVNLPSTPAATPRTSSTRCGSRCRRRSTPLEMITKQVVRQDYTYGQEFSFGLELVLDGLQIRLDRDH